MIAWRVEHNRFCRYFETEEEALRYQRMVARGRRRVVVEQVERSSNPPVAPHQARWLEQMKLRRLIR